MTPERFELLSSFIIAGLLLTGYKLYPLEIDDRASQETLSLWLGIVGLLLLVITEVLYSLRKQLKGLRLGRLRYWLSCHILTGFVGPWLVLLHGAFRFRGWAGFALALTVLVMISGLVGRYLYTRLSRTRRTPAIKTAQRLLRLWRQIHIPLGLTMFAAILIHIAAVIYFGALAQ